MNQFMLTVFSNDIVILSLTSNKVYISYRFTNNAKFYYRKRKGKGVPV